MPPARGSAILGDFWVMRIDNSRCGTGRSLRRSDTDPCSPLPPAPATKKKKKKKKIRTRKIQMERIGNI